MNNPDLNTLHYIIKLLDVKYNFDTGALMYQCFENIVNMKIKVLSLMYIIIDEYSHNESEKHNFKYFARKWMYNEQIESYEDLQRRAKQYLEDKMEIRSVKFDFDKTKEMIYYDMLRKEISGQQVKSQKRSASATGAGYATGAGSVTGAGSMNMPVYGGPTYNERANLNVVSDSNTRNQELYKLLPKVNIGPSVEKEIIKTWLEFQESGALRSYIIYFIYLVSLVSGLKISNLVAKFANEKDTIKLIEDNKIANNVISKFDTFFMTHTYPEYQKIHENNKYIKVKFKPEFLKNYLNFSNNLKGEKLIENIQRNLIEKLYIPTKTGFISPVNLRDKRYIQTSYLHGDNFDYKKLQHELESLVNSTNTGNKEAKYKELSTIFKNAKKKDLVDYIDIVFFE